MCVGRPCPLPCPMQTSQPDSGPQRNLSEKAKVKSFGEAHRLSFPTACYNEIWHPLLTGAFMQHVVQGSVWHPVCDESGVRSRRRLTGTEHWEHVGM